MRDAKINNWKELADLVDRHKRQKGWIYRGITRMDFELKPKVGRKDARKDHRGNVLSYSERQERLLLEEFKRQARPLLTVEPKSDLEWMAVAQHHGPRTRLLDWTESLLVAAMFATERGIVRKTKQTGEEVASIQPVIYGIFGLPEAKQVEDPFSLKNVKVYRPAHISNRIAPQQAVFTIHPKPDKKFDDTKLMRWILVMRGTLEVKLALDAVGINRAALFPGIDGLADALNWRHKWGMLRG